MVSGAGVVARLKDRRMQLGFKCRQVLLAEDDNMTEKMLLLCSPKSNCVCAFFVHNLPHCRFHVDSSHGLVTIGYSSCVCFVLRCGSTVQTKMDCSLTTTTPMSASKTFCLSNQLQDQVPQLARPSSTTAVCCSKEIK